MLCPSKILVVGADATNCYILINEGDCFVIDPGAPDERIIEAIREFCPLPRSVSLLLTHSHWDHFLGADWLISVFPDCRLYVSAADLPGLYDPALNLSENSGETLVFQSQATVSLISDGDQLKCGSWVIDVAETPGHTLGGVCFLVVSEKVIFTGDTLFHSTIGRGDCAPEMEKTLDRSIKTKILTLPDDFRIFPGHYGSSTVGEEHS
jgi:glyoxylase-like metal-dependent hydrolase (beta-lactamase superfamily II)